MNQFISYMLTPYLCMASGSWKRKGLPSLSGKITGSCDLSPSTKWQLQILSFWVNGNLSDSLKTYKLHKSKPTDVDLRYRCAKHKYFFQPCQLYIVLATTEHLHTIQQQKTMQYINVSQHVEVSWPYYSDSRGSLFEVNSLPVGTAVGSWRPALKKTLYCLTVLGLNAKKTVKTKNCICNMIRNVKRARLKMGGRCSNKSI